MKLSGYSLSNQKYKNDLRAGAESSRENGFITLTYPKTVEC